MQKIMKKISSLLLAILLCLGITVAVGSVSAETVVVDAATSSDYYADISATGGNQLLGQLHDLITTTHTTYTSYDAIKTYAKDTDPGLDGNGVLEFYTHESIMEFSGTVGTWNREHVWCQSNSNGLWGKTGGGADLHHIRPTESGLNSTRGNNKYGPAKDGGKEAWSRKVGGANSKLGGWVQGSTFEPLDEVKGDVARIVMYVYTHYNTYKNVYGTTNGKGSYFGTLNFTHIMSPTNEKEAIALLLKWNKEDEVDPIETLRNEEVYKIQGNRNPFIDHPEYADAIWGGGSVTPGTGSGSGGGSSSTTLTGLTISPSTLNLTAGNSGTLTVSATPSTASNAVTWTSSNTAVATVSNGTVTALSEGSATITARSTVNNNIAATATVRVTGGTSTPSTPGVKNGSFTIDIKSFPTMSKTYDFQKWESGGVNGIAYIYGGTNDKMQFTNKDNRSCYLASTTPTPAPIRSVTVQLTDGSKNWKLLTSTSAYGKTQSGNPTNGNDRETKQVSADGVTWTVSGNDTYFALVYAESSSGACYIKSIEVTYAGDSGGTTPDPSATLTGLSLNHTSVEFEVGNTVKLSATPNPVNADASVTWSSSDNSVASVSADGLVTAVKEGTATITATSTVDPTIKATCQITVNASEVEAPPAGENPAGPEDFTSDSSGFHSAVEAIALYHTLPGRYGAITTAISLYNTLKNAGTALNSGDIAALNAAIAKYNADVISYNTTAESADNSALHAFMR